MTRAANILIVSFDALRRDYVSVYQKDAHKDDIFSRAARDGIVFDNAIANSNWTVPSHASLFTGIEPQVNGIYNWRERVPHDVETIFDRAREDGYRTACLSSEGVGMLVDNRCNEFDLFGETKSGLDKEIEDDPDRPWCVFWHFLDTHAPYNIKADRPARLDHVDWEVSDPTINYLRELVCTGRTDEITSRVRENFFQVGSMVDDLWTRLGDNTVVCLLSDHGEQWRPHQPFHCAFEMPVMRIPFVVRAPGLTPSRHDGIVSHCDVMDVVWGMAVAKNAKERQAIAQAKPFSEEHGRVSVCGPDAFDNNEVFFGVATATQFVLEKPSTGSRRYFDIGGNHKAPVAQADVDDEWVRLAQKLDPIVAKHLEPAQDRETMSEGDVDTLLLELEKLGYI